MSILADKQSQSKSFSPRLPACLRAGEVGVFRQRADARLADRRADHQRADHLVSAVAGGDAEATRELRDRRRRREPPPAGNRRGLFRGRAARRRRLALHLASAEHRPFQRRDVAGHDVADLLFGHVAAGADHAHLAADVVVQVYARRGRDVAEHFPRLVRQRVARRTGLRRRHFAPAGPRRRIGRRSRTAAAAFSGSESRGRSRAKSRPFRSVCSRIASTASWRLLDVVEAGNLVGQQPGPAPLLRRLPPGPTTRSSAPGANRTTRPSAPRSPSPTVPTRFDPFHP